MADLPADLIAEILSRLPAKSLVRFRCVCKSWQTLTADRYFIRAHLNREVINKNPSRLLLMYNAYPSGNEVYSVRYAETPGEEFMNLDPPFSPSPDYVNLFGSLDDVNVVGSLDHVRLVGSCNGLLCLSDAIRYPHSTIYLWNPSIMECRTLPDSHHFSRIFGDLGVVRLAFGFDVLNDDYKVVKIVYFYGVERFEVEVYSLRRDSWKKIGNTAPLQLDCISYLNQVVVNGSAHWIAKRFREPHLIPLIVSFNMANEVFCEILVPDIVSSEGTRLGLLGGWLSLVSYIPYQNCEVWVMKEYGVVQSWTKQHVITQHAVISVMDRPLGLTESGEFLLANRCGGLISYDPKSEKVEDFGICIGPYTCLVTTYVESLVSVMPVMHGSSCRIGCRGNNNIRNKEERRMKRRGILNSLIPWSFLAPFGMSVIMYGFLIYHLSTSMPKG